MKITPIKIRRINAGLETEEAYKKLEISKSTFYKIEQGHGTPSAQLIARIAKLYNCKTDDIFKDLKITG
ncbi:helix-turn-helix transcriptional regulator [Clostridium sardiniense]|uniref:Helix-turn-helix transcriptional regulator n=1 Tax=Clostridium sardiniense TaxID=29369 RepID=A0ABS7KW74_CLOSR|nr:helix-turn-helix transcriptional regulator [Clostridium sardiniense]MBY0755061.1 helix-turn-helix transcriptional regulator [Clostridium sardiniense]MDQ0459081.1 DNA-binding XRE family transcriptional regulator [Clostridium sardiniense]